jgi:4-methylaminobutanoate oxidase (formaldehyde-forming)
MDSALHRIPALEETGIRKFYNGPESFTPDNQFLLGETPEVRGLFIGAGFNSVGIASAGGAGRALAEWIVSGEAQTDLTGVDVRRFARFNANNRWLRDRVGEVLGLHYSVPWPNREFETARPFRRSPLHHLHERDGALFGSKMGWERPNVFAPSGSSLSYSWTAPEWLPWTAAEQRATRSAVAVFDQTSFSKLLVTGPDAERALQWLCTADVAVPPGRAVYTGLLNSRGTYESDVTVTGLDDRSYLLLSSAATTERDKDHLRRNLPPGAYAEVVDVTSAYSVLGVMGPASRDLLSSLTDADLSESAFPFGTSREITLGYATVRATRMTYVGELGWELLIPADLTVGVYEDLLRAGSGHGLARAGYYAIEALRLEKGYRAFGRELTPDIDPVVAGLRFTCKRSEDFLGRAAVESAVAAGPSARRIVSFVVEDPEALAWGGELLLREGRGTGLVTSAAFGATVGASVGLALLTRTDGPVTKEWLAEGGFEIDISGRRFPVRVTLGSPLPK